MSEDDVLFGYRLRVLDYAARTPVSEACRVFGIHRSTYYVWKRRVERHGLEILRPRERRRPRLPNQLSPFLEARIVAFAPGHPGFGPRRIASELRRERWGGIVVSHNGVWRCLRRHGLNTRAKRLSLVAGYAAPYQPPRKPERERHIEAERPGELVGIEAARAHAQRQRRRVSLPRLPRHARPARRPPHPDPRRPSQTNGNVEALHRLILEECWRPAFARYLHVRFTGLKRDLQQYINDYNFDRPHHGRLTQGRIPADIVYDARKVTAR